jgi:molybdopterin-binding protein
MRVGARNVPPAIIKSDTAGAVDSAVVMERALGIKMGSIITEVSADKLALKAGGKFYALIKAPNVMIGVD